MVAVRGLLAACLVAGLLAASPSVAGALPGDADPAYGGGDGAASFNGATTADNFEIFDMVELAGGKTIAVGGLFGQLFAVRLNADGTVDTTYGADGHAGLFGGFTDGAQLGVDGSGRLLAVSTARVPQAGADAVITRLTSDGHFDAAWGGGQGYVLVDAGGATSAIATALTVQSDSKPVVAIRFGNGETTLRRYTTAGAADATWGGDGIVDVSGDANVVSLDQRTDGDIVSFESGTVRRYNSSGTAGASFVAGSMSVGAVDASNRVLVAGTQGPSGSIQRFTNTGAVDVGFGLLGTAGFSFGLGYDHTVHDISLAADGAPTIGVQIDDGQLDIQGRVIRRLATGAVDAAFSTDGIVELPEHSAAAVLTTAAGQAMASFDNTFPPQLIGNGVIRYTSAGAPDAAFSGNGIIEELLPQRKTNDETVAVAGRAGGGMFVAVNSEPEAEILATTGAGALDATYAGDGIAELRALFDNDEVDLADIVVDPSGRVVAVGVSNSPGGCCNPTGFVLRLTTAGVPDATFGGGDGLLPLPQFDVVSHIENDTANQVIVAGSSPTDEVLVARVTALGVLDPTFDGDGIRPVGTDEDLGGLAVDASRRITVATNGVASTRLHRFVNGAVPDPTYGSAGVQTIPNPSVTVTRRIGAVLPEPGGQVTIVGVECTNPFDFCDSDRLYFQRRTPSGAIDPAYGIAGTTLVDAFGFTPGFEQLEGAVRQSDGAVLAITQDDGGDEVVVATRVVKVLPSGAVDTSFSGDGVAPVTSVDDRPAGIGLTPTNQVVIGGSINAGPSGDVSTTRLQNPRPLPAAGGEVAIPPARLLDTRNAGEGPCVSEPGGRSVIVTGVGGVPANASSVTLNVTVTQPTFGGFLTVWPTGQQRPTASNINYLQGQTIGNTVIARVGAGGKISIYAKAGCPHVVVDVLGWSAGGSPAAGGLTALTPARLLDTRSPGSGPCISGAGPRNLKVTGVGGVPASGVGAVALNVTATAPTGNGFLTVWPAGVARPTASNLNFTTGETIPNTVLVKVGTGGNISFFANAGCPHIVVDVVGWFSSGTPAAGGFAGLTPARLLDTRVAGQGPCVSGQAGRTLQVTGAGGVPASGVGAVALNVTVTGPAFGGYLTVWPNGQFRPTTSNLNFNAGQTIPNTVIVKVGTGGKVTFFANAGCPNVVVDVVGWFAAVPLG